MSTTTKSVTAEELLRMPDDGVRYELIAGELIAHEPAGHVHGRVASRIAISIGHHVVENDLGEVYAAETGFLIGRNPDTVRAPDMAFVVRRRVDDAGDTKGYFPGAPDLAVEVISPGDVYGDVEAKALAWLGAGTRMVLTLNPRKRAITVYRSPDDISNLTDDAIVDGGDVVPGWQARVADLFR